MNPNELAVEASGLVKTFGAVRAVDGVDLAAAMGRPRRLAQQATYCLRHAGVIEQVDKDGNTVVYGRCGAAAHAND